MEGVILIEAAFAAASAKDREFLHALAIDDSPSAMADIIHRTESWPALMPKCKNCLLDAGLIDSAGHGKVNYAIPGIREYLHKQPRLLTPKGLLWVR